MPRLMFDSTTPEAIPADAEMVAGYVNGKYTWTPQQWARFPKAVKIGISVTADHSIGDVLDVENGDATPAQAPGWIQARQKAGARFTTIYCSESRLAEVEAACKGLNYYRWIAWYGQLWVPEHPLATVQCANPPMLGGRNVDVSIVWNEHWHPSPVPVPAWVPQAATDAAELAVLLRQHAG